MPPPARRRDALVLALARSPSPSRDPDRAPPAGTAVPLRRLFGRSEARCWPKVRLSVIFFCLSFLLLLLLLLSLSLSLSLSHPLSLSVFAERKQRQQVEKQSLRDRVQQEMLSQSAGLQQQKPRGQASSPSPRAAPIPPWEDTEDQVRRFQEQQQQQQQQQRQRRPKGMPSRAELFSKFQDY